MGGRATDSDVVRMAVAALKEGDRVSVVVSSQSYSLRGYTIRLRCNRQAWPSELVRGGMTAEMFIGVSRSKPTAERRAARVMKILKACGGNVVES